MTVYVYHGPRGFNASTGTGRIIVPADAPVGLAALRAAIRKYADGLAAAGQPVPTRVELIELPPCAKDAK